MRWSERDLKAITIQDKAAILDTDSIAMKNADYHLEDARGEIEDSAFNLTQRLGRLYTAFDSDLSDWRKAYIGRRSDHYRGGYLAHDHISAVPDDIDFGTFILENAWLSLDLEKEEDGTASIE